MKVRAYRSNAMEVGAPSPVIAKMARFVVDIAVDLGGGRLSWGAGQLGPFGSVQAADRVARVYGRCARVVRR